MMDGVAQAARRASDSGSDPMTNWPIINASGDPEVERTRARLPTASESAELRTAALLLAAFCGGALLLSGTADADDPAVGDVWCPRGAVRSGRACRVRGGRGVHRLQPARSRRHDGRAAARPAALGRRDRRHAERRGQGGARRSPCLARGARRRPGLPAGARAGRRARGPAAYHLMAGCAGDRRRIGRLYRR